MRLPHRASALRIFNMMNSTDSLDDTLTILRTLDGKLRLVDCSTLPDGGTPEMLRFVECVIACTKAGLDDGCHFDQLQRANGTCIVNWLFDRSKPAGVILLLIYKGAEQGIMPPDADTVINIIQLAMQ